MLREERGKVSIGRRMVHQEIETDCTIVQQECLTWQGVMALLGRVEEKPKYGSSFTRD